CDGYTFAVRWCKYYNWCRDPRRRWKKYLEEEFEMEKVQMLIDGNWVGDETNQWIDVINPSTGALATQIVRGNEKHAADAVQAAKTALSSKEWRAIKPFERGQLLVETARYIREHAEELSEMESRDIGKPKAQADADIEAAARYFEFYGG